ncbi:hypothetical protein E2C01_051494 [Portunus trituberculatus]|uniref:Uncharacterized protein n=1 Tax=Portunus trituberculatus TaxID=210409 RepID=A0A5B7GJA2_PORTR|nr:hypothetical protein [Portunus trituberculatus]
MFLGATVSCPNRQQSLPRNKFPPPSHPARPPPFTFRKTHYPGIKPYNLRVSHSISTVLPAPASPFPLPAPHNTLSPSCGIGSYSASRPPPLASGDSDNLLD